MTINQLASLGKIEAMKKRARYDDPLPSWVYKERYRYPYHTEHSRLIAVYKETLEERDQRIDVIQFAVKRRLQEGYQETPETAKSLEDCKRQEKEAQETLKQAARELEAFINHTPAERIAIYEAEIAELEIKLSEAHAAELEYTEKMLSDPDAARKRLDRMLQGHKGDKAEYSQEQLSQLRTLKSEVETLKSKLWSHKRDIQIIRELVAEEERKAEVKAKMDAALPEFNQVCKEFVLAWDKLKNIASENDVRLSRLHTPIRTEFQQNDNIIQLIYED